MGDSGRLFVSAGTKNSCRRIRLLRAAKLNRSHLSQPCHFIHPFPQHYISITFQTNAFDVLTRLLCLLEYTNHYI